MPKSLRRLLEKVTFKGYRETLLQQQKKNEEAMQGLFRQVFLNNPVLLLEEIKIYLPLFYKDHIQKTIYQTKSYYEFETLEFLRLHYRQFSYIVDIGSNIGNHMLFFCSKLNAESVICFEPNQFNRENLEINVALNHLENIVKVYPYAVGKEPGFGTQSGFSLINTGMNRIVRLAAPSVEEHQVEIRSLDSFVLKRLDFLKIDVEGFELEVLLGASETIQQCKPVILVEVFEGNQSEVDTLLCSYGYRKFFAFKEFDLLYVPT